MSHKTKLCHIYLICPSLVGGLPVAEILTAREDTATVVHALELLKFIRTTMMYISVVHVTSVF